MIEYQAQRSGEPALLIPVRVIADGLGRALLAEPELTYLIAQGKSNREIAEQLVISETTAERQIANILSKF